ncbi:MAG: acetylornithine deacetylase [Gammaproteobacteria bacterium]|nr:MAG: acetylornithine deacetylase [Gammaproteobacteria bacterium]UCH40233.1 MAG: acetylornithine deacetylase [Gammaproteobacteria bacterium]
MNSEEILARLVAFDTTSTRSNLELIDFVRNLLDEQHIASQLVLSEDQTRANLFATIGHDDVGGVMLSGHTDVVPTTGQDWHSDPYQLKLDDDTLFGRGTCDMKGFIACVLAGLPQMAAQKLETPIHLALSYDEEIGCVGARKLAATMAGFDVRPKIGIIGEPTSMKMVLGHKGKISFRVSFSGLSCHSAYISSGVNAVEYAAELIAYIRKMNQRLQQQALDHSYTVPHTTFHVGNISGGTALNIVPEHCEFEFEIRNLPQDDLDAMVHDIKHYANDVLLAEMRSRHPQSQIRFDEISHYPGLHTNPESGVIAYTRAINPVDGIGDNVSFGTEAGLFDNIGINSLVCGPGSIDQAHKPDEFVTRVQLHYCDQMIENLVHRCRETAEFG